MTRDPIIPGNIRDRTGTAGIMRRAIAQIKRRFSGLRRDVLAIWGGVRTLEANEAGAAPRTIYAMTPDEMAATSQALREALERWIAGEREPAHSFWWSVYDQEASQAGAAQSVTNLTRLSLAYGAARSLQQVVFSEAYRNRVALAQLKSYEHWTGLSAGMRSELSQIIGRAVVDGKNPRAVRTEIIERLGVSRARAAQYAQTDITDTLRQARVAEAEHAEEEFGIRIGLLWTSALIPTTRPWHASRNGRVYSADEVRGFYGQSGNRYNCHCATTECLLDTDGKPILTKKLQGTMAGEKKAWQSRYAK
jgi:hypothetical protein